MANRNRNTMAPYLEVSHEGRSHKCRSHEGRIHKGRSHGIQSLDIREKGTLKSPHQMDQEAVL